MNARKMTEAKWQRYALPRRWMPAFHRRSTLVRTALSDPPFVIGYYARLDSEAQRPSRQP